MMVMERLLTNYFLFLIIQEGVNSDHFFQYSISTIVGGLRINPFTIQYGLL